MGLTFVLWRVRAVQLRLLLRQQRDWLQLPIASPTVAGCTGGQWNVVKKSTSSLSGMQWPRQHWEDPELCQTDERPQDWGGAFLSTIHFSPTLHDNFLYFIEHNAHCLLYVSTHVCSFENLNIIWNAALTFSDK